MQILNLQRRRRPLPINPLRTPRLLSRISPRSSQANGSKPTRNLRCARQRLRRTVGYRCVTQPTTKMYRPKSPGRKDLSARRRMCSSWKILTPKSRSRSCTGYCLMYLKMSLHFAKEYRERQVSLTPRMLARLQTRGVSWLFRAAPASNGLPLTREHA